MNDVLVGSYVLIRELALGGMGSVHEARHLTTGQRVAVKLLRADRAGSERARARFQREVETLRRLSHPAIVPILDWDLEAAVPYLVMPFVEGRSLEELVSGLRRNDPNIRRWVEDHVLPPGGGALHKDNPAWISAVALVGAGVAGALAAAHAVGLIHRDLKPGNIMVTPDQDVRLLDFGLARDLSAAPMTLTEEQLGTPLYMSPEQVTRGRAVDRRTDLYSLGMTLIEALTLAPPLRGASLPEVYRAITSDDPLRALRKNPGVGRPLSRVLGACVAKRPADRYADAAHLARDLAGLARGEVPHPPSPALWRRGLSFLVAHGRAATVLGLVTAAGWALTVARDHPPTATDLLAAARERAIRFGSEGRLEEAFDAHRAILRDHAGDPVATEGLLAVARNLVVRSEEAVSRFDYDRASRDLEVLVTVLPAAAPPERLRELRSLGFRTLQDVARALLRGSEVDQVRALDGLLRHPTMPVPATERDRLVLLVIDDATRSTRVRSLALRVAEALRLEAVVPRALRLAQDETVQGPLRESAVLLLGALGEPESTMPLLLSLAKKPASLGELALRILARKGNEGAMAAIRDALAEEGPRRRATLQGLGEAKSPGFSEPARSEMVKQLVLIGRLPSDAEKQLVIAALEKLGSREAVPFLISTLRSAPSSEHRRLAARALALLRTGEEEAALVHALVHDRAREVREAAALALQPGSPLGQAALLRAAEEDPTGDVRARALVALGRGRVVAALGPALKALRTSEDRRARLGAILFAGLLRPESAEVVSLLTEILREGAHSDERRSAAWALGRLRHEGVLPALVSVLREEARRTDPLPALESAGSVLRVFLEDRGLRQMGSFVELVPRLVAERVGASPEIAEAVSMAIEKTLLRADAASVRAGVTVLLEVAKSAELPEIREVALGALGRLGAKARSAEPVLLDLLPAEGNSRLRGALALALARVGAAEIRGLLRGEPEPRDGEEALLRGLFELRCGDPEGARAHLVAAVRAGALDWGRTLVEPELVGFSLLGRWLGLAPP